MGEAQRKRQRACRCGSNKPAEACCLTASGWHKKPAILKLTDTGCSESHKACYLRQTNACSSKISGEHIVSETVLRVLAEQEIELSGLPWLRGEKKVLKFGALTTNCLCSVHNSALSAIDSAGGRFFAALQRSGADARGPNQHFIFSGHDIERWLFRTLMALAVSKNFAIDGAALENPVGSEIRISDLLANAAEWRTPLGIYAMQGLGYRVATRNTLELAPLVKRDDDQMVGMLANIQGFHLGLLASEQPIKGTGLDKAIFRPGRLIFKLGDVTHTVQMCWEDTNEHIDITLTWER